MAHPGRAQSRPEVVGVGQRVTPSLPRRSGEGVVEGDEDGARQVAGGVLLGAVGATELPPDVEQRHRGAARSSSAARSATETSGERADGTEEVGMRQRIGAAPHPVAGS